MPTGGVSEANLSSYIRLKNVIACGGSWMIKPELISAGDWAGITALCKSAVFALHGFSFAHMGINAADPDDAEKIAAEVGLFGFPPIPGNKSIFNGTLFETMKQNGRGKHGHIGFKTYNVDRALAYLEQFGYKPVTETAAWTGEPEKSPLKFVYLDKEINGFAVHLMLA
jgi:2-dehydro-3-deoxyphosphogluconate aldolase/(4S)-4-hydroxy-2-oxoglutarate aldolase